MNNDIGTCCCLSMVLIILIPLIILSRRKGKQHEKEISLQKEREREKAPQIAFYQHYPAIMTEFERIMRTNKDTFRYYVGYEEIIDYNELCRIYKNEIRLPVRYEGGYLYFDVAPVRNVLQQIDSALENMDTESVPDAPLEVEAIRRNIARISNELFPAINPEDVWKLFNCKNDTVSMTNRDKYIYVSILKRLIEEDKYFARDGLKEMSKEYQDQCQRFYNQIHKKYPNIFGDSFLLLLDSYNKIIENAGYQYDTRYYANFTDDYNARIRDAQIEIRACLNGAGGEEIVGDFLENFYGQFRILKNVTLSDGKMDAECDFIIVAPQGIFVVEAKNYDSAGKEKIVIEKDGRWKHIYNDKEEILKNASAQNDIHIAVIKNILANKGFDEQYQKNVKGLVVITNEQVEIVNHDSKQQVIRYTGIVREIQEKEAIYDERQIEELLDVIKSKQIPDKKFAFKNHYKTCYLYKQEWEWNYYKSLQNVQKFDDVRAEINSLLEKHKEWLHYKNMYEFYFANGGLHFTTGWMPYIPSEIRTLVMDKWRGGYFKESNTGVNVAQDPFLLESEVNYVSEDILFTYVTKRLIEYGKAVLEVKMKNEWDENGRIKETEYRRKIYMYHDPFNED